MHLDSLTPLQRAFLRAFFRRDHRFFLSGGAALIGFYAGHRSTEDLDLFIERGPLDHGDRLVREVAAELGSTLESVWDNPNTKRYVLRRESEELTIDLVSEPPQWISEKPVFDGIRVDAPQQMLANKLGALPRLESRDLVDIWVLETVCGCSLESALRVALDNDPGLTAAQLATTLNEPDFRSPAHLPRGVLAAQLEHYRLDLVARLLRLAGPPAGPPRG